MATKAGVSTGSLFNYVESKEALFHMVFLFGLRDDLRTPPGPAGSHPGSATFAVIEAGLAQIQMPRMRAALSEEQPADVALELREILRSATPLSSTTGRSSRSSNGALSKCRSWRPPGSA